MRIPKAPTWTFVFLFGAAWNAVVERSWWAATLCLVVAFVTDLVGRRMKPV
jgi:hypothetical protein